ncbi:MAG TPA: hypothetical protein VEW48_14980 [Thermoanaerobaculia bacterium]|nr:hypothetical protein [Thermoanaerobaculia bacterium]
MVRLAFRSKLALAFLVLALLAPLSAQALPLGSPPAEPLEGLVARLTGWITAFFGDVGCSMDPGGLCHSTSVSQPPAATDQLDVGCSMDPSGGACHG